MSGEATAEPVETTGKTASIVAAVYFVSGFIVAGYLSYLNPSGATTFFLNFLFWGLPLALLAIGFRRNPRGTAGWALIVLGWILLIINLSTCSSTLTLRGQVKAVGDEFERKAAAIQSERETALNDTGWYDFPNPDKLHADAGLQATREMLATVRSIYERQEIQNAEFRNDWLNAIRSLEGPPHKIDEYVLLVGGFYIENEARLSRIQDAYIEIVVEADHLVDLLAKTPRSWTVENGRPNFSSGDDARLYDQHLQRIRELDAEIVQTQLSLQQ